MATIIPFQGRARERRSLPNPNRSLQRIMMRIVMLRDHLDGPHSAEINKFLCGMEQDFSDYIRATEGKEVGHG